MSIIDKSRRTNATIETQVERPKRTPVSGARDILTVSNIPEGLEPFWINDVGDELLRFREAGYEFWTDKGVKVGDKTVNSSSGVGSPITKNVGNGITAYLMVQRKEWADEDRAAKQRELDEQEAELFRELNAGADGRYGGASLTK